MFLVYVLGVLPFKRGTDSPDEDKLTVRTMVLSPLPARSLGSRSIWPVRHALMPLPVARVYVVRRPVITRQSRFCSTAFTSLSPSSDQKHLHSTLTEAQMAEFRLPTNVIPRHYNLTIKTDLHALTFDGFASVE